MGSIALGLAELAGGVYDVMISNCIGKGNVWDVAGGMYLLNVAGCETYNYRGNPINHYEGSSGMIVGRPEHLEQLGMNVEEVHTYGN